LLADWLKVNVPIDGAQQMNRRDPIIETKILEHRGRLRSTAHHRVASASAASLMAIIIVYVVEQRKSAFFNSVGRFRDDS